MDRLLSLLRNKIQAQGFTQLDVQQALGWGRSYISQLLTKQKKIRVDQVLLILNVIGVDPAEFYGELYQAPAGPRHVPAGSARPPVPGPAEEQERELHKLRALLDGVVGVLLKKRLITSRDLRGSVVAGR